MIAVTADIQLHNHAPWSRILESGRNSRLQDGINCLFQATSKLKRGDHVVLLGDIFESRKHLDIGVLTAFSEWIDSTSLSGISIVLVCGNHDQWLNSGTVYSLRPWKEFPNVTIVDSYKRMLIDGVVCDFYAYHDDYDLLKKKISQEASPEYLFLHQAFVGASMDNGESCMVGLSEGDLTGSVATFLGHFHNPQQVSGKGHYIGSPYQINRGESGQQKRYVLINGHDWESEPTSAPSFHTVSFDEYLLKRNDTDFFTVVCESESQFVKSQNARFIVLDKPKDEIESREVAFDMLTAIRAWCQERGCEHLYEAACGRYSEAKSLS